MAYFWVTWGARLFAALVVGGLAVTGTLWATRAPASKPSTSIAEQWIQAVSQFGLEPLYPPQEDFLVGDVLAIITADAAHDISKSPLPTRSIKLHHMDMTAELEAVYAQTYQFPRTGDRPAQPGDIWGPASGTESIFKVMTTPRTSLPIAMLPSFSVASARFAELSGLISGAALGLHGSSDSLVEIKVDGVETYGVPALPAETALIEFCTGEKTASFCTDQGVRTQLSMIVGQKIFDTMEVGPATGGKKTPRYSVEVALVSRAYLVRSIETTISSGSGVNAGGQTGAATTTDKQASTSRDSSPAAKGDVDARMAKTVSLAETSSAPGAATVVRQADATSISITKTLARPIVIGFRSVRWRPGS